METSGIEVPEANASDAGTLGIVNTVFTAWANGIRDHRPEEVASQFTEDALFQGFDRDHGIGRPAIIAYYDKQPAGLQADFRILQHRRLSVDVLVAYADVDFSFLDGRVIPVHLTVVLQRTGGSWLISHYHVSKIQ
ncbi:SgcJ/EcaC family oxidoreductase [Arthrobacter sp. MSA 4-2]|uniref:SgcJ/EcaC family oxidoreductase n=1 Tax=Arthrobacter sp. MSA 4-2 TaxID=2794349 RepID=UPI0018E79AEC|nr:SgcJ/EcaC family oxidoreductase [Arthrobacter sp. MSA 4-2]MBJ2120429.1 SgcJ/EcaC family oxidoreductase [Arthrobacter sp. MSA 4-2]